MSAGRKPGPRRRLTTADLVALVALRDGPAHGHAIWTFLSDRGVQDWASVSRAQVYYSLGKLAEQGLIQTTDTAANTPGERTTWRITPAGRRALKAELSMPHWPDLRTVPPFMTWVALSELARPAARREILDRRRTLLESELSRERETLSEIQQLSQDMEGVKVAVLMVGHVIDQLELELELLDGLQDLFQT